MVFDTVFMHPGQSRATGNDRFTLYSVVESSVDRLPHALLVIDNWYRWPIDSRGASLLQSRRSFQLSRDSGYSKGSQVWRARKMRSWPPDHHWEWPIDGHDDFQ